MEARKEKRDMSEVEKKHRVREKKIISSELKKEDHVWKQGLVDWCTANEIEELKQIFLSTPPPIKG